MQLRLQTDISVLNFSKAFGKVRQRCLEELRMYGVDGETNNYRKLHERPLTICPRWRQWCGFYCYY